VLATAGEEAFWRSIASLQDQIGADPVLVIRPGAKVSSLRRMLRGQPGSPPNIRVVQRPRDARGGGSYIATIEGVDVFQADGLSPGVAWLFSARALEGIKFVELAESGQYVDVSFELDADTVGTLRFRFRLQADWADTPIFEIREVSAPAEL
jgi:hypothetical protein